MQTKPSVGHANVNSQRPRSLVYFRTAYLCQAKSVTREVVSAKAKAKTKSKAKEIKIANDVVTELLAESIGKQPASKSVANGIPRVQSLKYMASIFREDELNIHTRFQDSTAKSVTHYANAVATSEPSVNRKEDKIFAIMAGNGRGKTRYLHELANELNKRTDTFAVAISFNAAWSRCPNILGGELGEAREASSTAEALLGVSARLWSMVTNVAHDVATQHLSDTISAVAKMNGVDDTSRLSSVFATMVLRQLVLSLVKLHREHTKPNITRFVLLVDETLLGEEEYRVGLRYNNTSTLSSNADEPGGMLALISRAIVSARRFPVIPSDDLFVFKSDFRLQGSLVLSVLQTQGVGVFDKTKRMIVAIPLLDELDAREVVDHWLPKLASKSWARVRKDNPDVAFKADLLISTLVQLPRAVVVVSKCFKEGQDMLSPGKIGGLLERMSNVFDEMYSFHTKYLPANVAKHLLGGTEMSFPEIEHLITDAVLTISMKEFVDPNNKDKFSRIALVPRTSVFHLWTFAKNPGNGDAANEYLAPVAWMMEGLLRHLSDDEATKLPGTPLEIVARQAINLRFSVMAAQTTEDRTLSVYDLLHGRKVANNLTFEGYMKIQSFSHLHFAPGRRSQVKLVEDEEWNAKEESSKRGKSSKKKVTFLLGSSNCLEYLERHARGRPALQEDFQELSRVWDRTDQGSKDVKTALSNRYRDAVRMDFLHDVNKVEHSLEHPDMIVRQLRLARTESADGGWLLRDATTKKAFLLLVDAKSAAISNDAEKKNNWDQAKHWREVSLLAKEKAQSRELKLVPGSAAEALAKGRYFFVYLDPRAGQTEVYHDIVRAKSSPGPGQEGDENGEEVDVRVPIGVRLEEAAVESIMGPMKQMYRVVMKMALSTVNVNVNDEECRRRTPKQPKMK